MSKWNDTLVLWGFRDPAPVVPPAPLQIAINSRVNAQRDLLAAKLLAEEAVAEVDMLTKRVARLAADVQTLGATQ